MYRGKQTFETRIQMKWTFRSSRCGTTGLAASLRHWDAGSIPSQAQWVKDLALPQLWSRSELPLRRRSDPWPGNSICFGEAEKRKKQIMGREKRAQEGEGINREVGAKTKESGIMEFHGVELKSRCDVEMNGLAVLAR